MTGRLAVKSSRWCGAHLVYFRHAAPSLLLTTVVVIPKAMQDLCAIFRKADTPYAPPGNNTHSVVQTQSASCHKQQNERGSILRLVARLGNANTYTVLDSVVHREVHIPATSPVRVGLLPRNIVREDDRLPKLHLLLCRRVLLRKCSIKHDRIGEVRRSLSWPRKKHPWTYATSFTRIKNELAISATPSSNAQEDRFNTLKMRRGSRTSTFDRSERSTLSRCPIRPVFHKGSELHSVSATGRLILIMTSRGTETEKARPILAVTNEGIDARIPHRICSHHNVCMCQNS